MSLEGFKDKPGNTVLIGVRDTQGLFMVRGLEHVRGTFPIWPQTAECLIVGKAEWDAQQKAICEMYEYVHEFLVANACNNVCLHYGDGIHGPMCDCATIRLREASRKAADCLIQRDSASPPETRKEAAE